MRWPTALLASTTFLVVACGERTVLPSTPTALRTQPAAAGIRVVVNPAAVSLVPRASVQLTTIMRDARGEEVFGAITWTSSNPEVATVDSNGLVQAVSPGSAQVTAAALGASGAAQVTVLEVPAPGFESYGLTWRLELAGQGLEPLAAVWGSSATDVFAVGQSRLWDCCGVAMHYDGANWNYMSIPPMNELTDIWGSSAHNVFATGDLGVLHYDGATWRQVANGTFAAVWGSSATNVFAVGWSGGLHYDGQAWRPLTLPSLPELWLMDVWGSSANDVFVVGYYDPVAMHGVILHYDGRAWSATSVPTWGALTSVWGSSGRDVFALGPRAFLHYDGTGWTPVQGAPAIAELDRVWGSSAADVYVTGFTGAWYGPGECCAVLLHYDGTSWSSKQIRTGQVLYGMWGSSPDNVYLVGTGPTILHGVR